MALYGNTDSNANKTKVEGVRGNGPGSQSQTVVFVDAQEANLAENKARGISGPGWWAFATYSQGTVTRTKAECLAVISNPEANSAESQTDDTIAADFGITIDSQPASVSVAGGSAGQFVVAAVSRPTGGTLSFQWQVSTDAGSNFANSADAGVVSGSATNTLAISDVAGLDANQYRCVVSVVGGADVTSSAATLTVT
tara:strand:- start:430 stop:1020 length:591 start_codon:yes stop_codon:yes gene_type:complete